jgi:NDP-sugar pyrophosphorylase family protein
MQAVILAGGKGTRLAPYTRVFPKPMMPIGDKTILEILLGQMKRAGINHVALTVGHLAGLMRAFFQDGKQYNLNITYVHEETPLGTAGPLSQVPGLGKTFLVSNGDVLTLLDIADLIRFHRQNKGICTIAMHERKVKIDLGVIEMIEGDCCISGYVEKPTIDYKVSMGLYVFEPRVLDYIPKGEYLDFPDLVKKLLAAGERVVGYPFSGYWQDLGRPDDYEQAAQDFESMRALFIPE